MTRCELGLPRSLAFEEASIQGDPEDAVRQLVGRLEGPDRRVATVITERRAFGVATRARHLGIAVVPDPPDLPALARSFFATEHPFAQSSIELACCLAAKRAALAALGHEGDVFDDPHVRVLSVAPPRLWCGLVPLELVLRIVPEGALAIVHSEQ
jgi:hypothetical protein